MISNKFPDVIFVASNEMVEELFKKKYPKLVKESETKNRWILCLDLIRNLMKVLVSH